MKKEGVGIVYEPNINTLEGVLKEMELFLVNNKSSISRKCRLVAKKYFSLDIALYNVG